MPIAGRQAEARTLVEQPVGRFARSFDLHRRTEYKGTQVRVECRPRP